MDVREFIVGFHVWLATSVCKVEGYIKKVNDFIYIYIYIYITCTEENRLPTNKNFILYKSVHSGTPKGSILTVSTIKPPV